MRHSSYGTRHGPYGTRHGPCGTRHGPYGTCHSVRFPFAVGSDDQFLFTTSEATNLNLARGPAIWCFSWFSPLYLEKFLVYILG
jgi:hypothetical protein